MAKRIKIKLANDLHGNETSIVLIPIEDDAQLYRVTYKTMRACKLRLCPHPFGCECGDAFGARQGHIEVVDQDFDGNIIINAKLCVNAG